MLFKIVRMLFVTLSFSGTLTAETDPFSTSYQATYEVSKDGKPMAKQVTSLQTLPNQQYILEDRTKGTHGLASFVGLKRTETSEFTVHKSHWLVNKHDMKQQVTFSKKLYHFTHLPGYFKGTHKKNDFQINDQVKPISSHMLPLRVAYLACHQTLDQFSITVLKSDKPRQYQFKTVPSESNLIKVSRQYPENSPKESHVWLDPNRHCLPVKTKHISDGDVIETQIINFKATEVAN